MALKNKVGPITAIVVTVSAVAWIVLGGNGITVSPDISQPNNVEQASPSVTPEQKAAYPVQAKTLIAQSIEIHLPLSGTTLANEVLDVINTYPGRVMSRPVEQGQFVTSGTVLTQIDTRILDLEMQQAELLIKQRQLELDGIKRLNSNNLASKVNLAQAETDLATAKAHKQTLLVDRENATVTAPFSGIVNALHIQKGEVLSAGSLVGTLISLDPLKISVHVPQNKIHHISLGTQSTIRLESGDEIESFVSFISATANETSRTIRVEMEIPNPNNAIPAGLTASVDFLLDHQRAHAVSPALLTLNDAGNTSIKTINMDNRVVVTPVEIVKSERSQVWVRGLPDNVDIITVGQGFVSAGDTVQARYQD
ncbi:efflux RND transporter periplasmic adaptor subunit [Marinomonas algarum]|uniref:Efflux RND transporter periplasmic adaptor subunit n=1 Tax=Marinomonas algarum TaxID=2883105 RepID=A0A9X1IR67_9GAMM|nr:efflux RND transporter periplasmic adaptor subunit [Marinomonas algarum]MCB5162781.1 efflux RND transporter periplasmic adaptor subunit [Marinomonas algarum]